uniref:Uncharacterized protein n=1 Tax=Panagrolaimus davidi TaxID=227884 RepID=A0A914PKS0_9BILA
MVVAIGVDVNVGKGKCFDSENQTVRSFTFQKIDSSNYNTFKSLIREIKSFNLSKISHICITGCSNDREENLLEEAFDSLNPCIEFTISNDFECEYLYLYGLLERKLQQNENFAVIRITDSDASAEMFKLVGDKLVLFRYYFAQAPHSSMDSETAERLLNLINSERYCKNFVIQYLSFKHKWMCQKIFKHANIVYTKPVDGSRSAMLYSMMLAGIAKRIKIDLCSDNTIDSLPDATENGNIVLPKISQVNSSFTLPQVFQEYIKRVGISKRPSRSTVFSPKHYLEKFTAERHVQYARKRLCRMRSESY